MAFSLDLTFCKLVIIAGEAAGVLGDICPIPVVISKIFEQSLPHRR